MMNNNKYILSIILNVTLAALLFVVTIMYAIRTHPIIKILGTVFERTCYI